MCLVSGPTGGKEGNKEKGSLFDTLQLRPVLNNAVLTVEAYNDPATAAPIEPQNTAVGTEVSATEEKDEDRYQVRWGDTCWSIACRYGIKVTELTALNPGLDPEKIKSGDYLQVRRTMAPSRGLSGLRSTPGTTGREQPLFQEELFHPLRGARLTSRYGMRSGRLHRGIDLAAAVGTPICAAAAGTVTYAGQQSGYGLIVIVDHGAYQTKYAHNSENLVATGEAIRRGQPVAKVGRTGNATGNHLHFELVFEGEAIDPLPYLS
jgi:murein DD-endopeptidase MepM/ murein hydrolase activator NlpD